MKLLEQIEFKGQKFVSYCFPRNFNGFSMYFAQCSFTKLKGAFIKLQNEPVLKDIGQVLLIVNDSV